MVEKASGERSAMESSPLQEIALPSLTASFSSSSSSPVYAALDLGTNNCRLLIAQPEEQGFRIVDAFSRVVRLGEGLSLTGKLSEEAIQRTLLALEVCRSKMEQRGVTRARLVATEACRRAENGLDFIQYVRDHLFLHFDIIDRQTEIALAVDACRSLIDQNAQAVLLFDIGGGSSEIAWLTSLQEPSFVSIEKPLSRIDQWISLPLGVVTLAEKFGGFSISKALFEEMVAYVTNYLLPFVHHLKPSVLPPSFHFLGTSGTATTLAGVHLRLARYDRRRVDGLWMQAGEVQRVIEELRTLSYIERVQRGCIGPDRADLVVAGCAILKAIYDAFPSSPLRIADRGLREGLLLQMMREDQLLR